MPDELTLRDVLQQLGARIDQVGALVAHMGSRIERVEDDLRAFRVEVNERLAQIQDHIDRRFDRVTGLLVTVLLGIVVGIGGLWLK